MVCTFPIGRVAGMCAAAVLLVNCRDGVDSEPLARVAGEGMLAPEDSAALVGKLIYFDANLSTPKGQSCASCHSPDTGFAEPHAAFPVSQGVNPHLFGNRNAPSVAYAAYSSDFRFDPDDATYIGGQFWDGRAADLVEQAKGPFLNPLEMANPDKATVVASLHDSNYAFLFERLFGADVWDDIEAAYEHAAQAIAQYEKSGEVNRFASKYDQYLAGTADLSTAELRGLQVFESPNKGNCAACHPSRAASDATPPLFTDFSYDNLGVPKNPANPFYALPVARNPDGVNYVDLGLGGALGDTEAKRKIQGSHSAQRRTDSAVYAQRCLCYAARGG